MTLHYTDNARQPLAGPPVSRSKAAPPTLTRDAALAAVGPLVKAGFALHWLRPRDKSPISAEWTEAPVHTLATLTTAYRTGANLGLRLGIAHP